MALAAASLRRPGRAFAFILLLVSTRSESVHVSGSATGQALRAYLSRRAFGVFPKNSLCRGVLILPQDRSEYLRGRRRQALRTNLRRAENAGITCQLMDGQSVDLDEILEIKTWRRRGSALTDTDVTTLRSLLGRPEMTFVAARDLSGRLLAVAAVVIDEMVCLIEWAVATNHEARWALHTHLVDVLIAREVRCLLAEGGGAFGALGFARTVQHYQHLLGYELRHLSVAPDHETAGRGRRFALALASRGSGR
ncbi:MAG TPA: hypothetical protein VIH85_18265 [Solirubrobacteraceae bacterium]